MAVPQPTDARVPCPACRAPIHPIAGRCKHCKADLAALRQARPAAATALPPLAARARVATPAAVPVVVEAPRFEGRGLDDSQPILPPRPTGRMEATGTAKRSTWKSWPVLVIALASVAIIVAVILMMFPPGGGDAGTAAGKHVLEPPPAPDRMDTNPSPSVPQMPPPSAPHAQLTPPSPSPDDLAPTPAPAPLPPPRPVPTPVPNDPTPDPADPFSGLGGSLGGTIGGNQTGLMFALLKHSCDRAKACGNMDDMMKMTCDMQLPTAPAPTCAAAKRCLEKIDSLDCSGTTNDLSSVTSLMMSMNDCIEAMRC